MTSEQNHERIEAWFRERDYKPATMTEIADGIGTDLGPVRHATYITRFLVRTKSKTIRIRNPELPL